MGIKTFFSDIYSIKSVPVSIDPSTWEGYTGVMSGNVAGVKVNEQTAIAHDTVYSCVRDKSQSLGQLPVILRRNKKKVESGREYRIFAQKINEFQTVGDFIEMFVTCLELRGNFYATVERNKYGNISSITPLFNQMVGVVTDFAGRVVYTYATNDGNRVSTYPTKDFIHIKQNSKNGYIGLSPLSCKRAIGMGISQDTHLSSLMENGATPRGTLETDQWFDDRNAATTLREQFDERFAGVQKAGKTVLLENGVKFKPMSISPADAELLDERKYNREQICGIFGVPVHRIGGAAQSNKKDLEQENKDYYVNKLMPLGKKLEDAINYVLPDGLTIELDEKGFVRGNRTSMVESVTSEFKMGSISMNEMREDLGREEVDGGDVHAIDTNNLTFGLLTDIPKIQEENRQMAQQAQQAAMQGPDSEEDDDE